MKPNFVLRFLPRLQDILFFSIFLAALALGLRMLNMDGDLPRHLLTGRFILETKTIPTVEPFVYLYEGQPYISHEWLADIIFFLIQDHLGFAGLVILAATMLASTFTLIYSYVSTLFNIRLPVLALFLWGAACTSLNWVLRPHLFSMLLLAIWLILSDKVAHGKKVPIWAFFVTMLIWSNLHGEFIAGMLVLLAYTIGWTIEFLFAHAKVNAQIGVQLWLAFLVSGLASFINPATYHPYGTILGFVNNPFLMSRMAEANPPAFGRPEFLVLLGLLAMSIFLLSINPRRLTVGQAFLLAGFSALSLMAGRNAHLYGLVAPFVLAETTISLTKLKWVGALESILKNVEDQVNFKLLPIGIVLFFSLLIMGSNLRYNYSFSPTFFPVNAVAWLEEHPQEGRMFNDLNWGGYIAYHLWPKQKIFADSMADVTGEMTLQYEIALTMREGWNNIFLQNKINWVILPTDSELVHALENDFAWETIYTDSTAAILRQNRYP